MEDLLAGYHIFPKAYDIYEQKGALQWGACNFDCAKVSQLQRHTHMFFTDVHFNGTIFTYSLYFNGISISD